MSKGFTLIELLIVIAILGILATIILAINPVKRINQAKDSKTKADIAQIATAMQAYYAYKSVGGIAHYPAAVVDLVTAGELKSEPKNDGTKYTVIGPTGCTTSGATCTDIAVSAVLKDPATAGNVWCWRSLTGVATETTVAACTAAAVAAPTPTPTPAY